MCGHLCGLHITATITTPLAERTGFAFSIGVRRLRYFLGMEFKISTSLGSDLL